MRDRRLPAAAPWDLPMRHPVTCQPGRAGGTPDGEDTPRNVARMAAMEAALAADQVRQLRQPDFGRVETPPKTVIPFKEGERVSGITPDAAIQGYQVVNHRVGVAYDEPGRSVTTPVHLATPARNK